MKNKMKKTAFLIFSVLMSSSVLACSETGDFIVDKSLNIVIENCDHCSFETTTYKINEKSDVLVNMVIDDGYYIESINYDNSTITNNDNNVSILLKDVRYNLRLKIQIAKYPSIHLVKNENYVADVYDYILKDGKELNFNITVNENKELASCSYSDCDFINLNNNVIGVHLFNINSDEEISFVFEDLKYAQPPTGVEDEDEKYMYTLMPLGKGNTKYIYYCLNGGTLIDNETEQYGYYKKVDVANHLRPNTDIGTNSMKKDGYQLESWNTKKDGTGIRVGLGSRLTMENHNIVLFAQWKKETNPASFTYKVVNNETIITGFQNSSNTISELVIPNFINGYKVTYINKNSFKNLNIESLYLPLYLTDMDFYAFASCSITNLHFYDSAIFYQYSFDNAVIEKIYINAVEKPRFCKNEFCCFADKLDRLILNKDEKRIILYGGCNLSYGICSADIAAEFPGYAVFNMGVIGGTNSGFQMDCISEYVKEGDIIIHAPESMSPYQLMYQNGCENRMFNNLESNYDLISSINITKFGNFLNAYHDYSLARKNLEPCKYEDYCDFYNEFGDIKDNHEVEYQDELISREEYGRENYDFEDPTSIKYDASLVNQSSMELLGSYYKLYTDKGADVVFTFSPVNKDSLGKKELEEQSWLKFDSKIRNLLSYPIISKAEDYLYSSKYFFDTNYHLNLYGAKLRTNQLVRDLKNYYSTVGEN